MATNFPLIKITPSSAEMLKFHVGLNHPNTDTFYQLMTQKCPYLSVTKDMCEKTKKICIQCFAFPMQYEKNHVSTSSTTVSLTPNSVICGDFGELFSKCRHQNKKFMVLVDSFSRYTVAYPTKGDSSDEILRIFELWCASFGLPRVIQFDQCTGFMSNNVKKWASNCRIALKVCSVGVHTSNALPEGKIKVVKNFLKRNLANDNNSECWCNLLSNSMQNTNLQRHPYKNDIGDTYNYSAADLFFNKSASRTNIHRRFSPVPSSITEPLQEPVPINIEAIIQSRARDNQSRNSNLKDMNQIQPTMTVVLVNHLEQMTKNKRFVSLSAFFKVVQVQGSCITLSSVAPNGMLGNEIFTVHANYCRIVTQELIEQIADIDPETINKRVSDKYIVRKM